MSAAMDLIQAVEKNGGHFRIEGKDLVISPSKAAVPVIEELRKHKAELIAELVRLPAIPTGVRLVRWEPGDSPFQLSECEIVTESRRFIHATLRQLDARLNGKNWLAGNWTLSALIDRLAAAGCFVELENPSQALQ